MRLSRNQRETLLKSFNLPEETIQEIRDELGRRYEGVCNQEFVEHSLRQYVLGSYALELSDIISKDIKPSSSILDIGSGFGNFANAMQFLGCRSVGVEPSEFEVRISELHSSRIFGPGRGPEFICGSFQDVEVPKNGFSIVTLWNVLEHVADLGGILQFAYDALERGGSIYIVCPNYFSWSTEPHYQIPWNPSVGRSKQKGRQRLLDYGKSPEFFDTSVFPRSNTEVLRTLSTLGLTAESLITESQSRFRRLSLFQSMKIRIPIKSTISIRVRRKN